MVVAASEARGRPGSCACPTGGADGDAWRQGPEAPAGFVPSKDECLEASCSRGRVTALGRAAGAVVKVITSAMCSWDHRSWPQEGCWARKPSVTLGAHPASPRHPAPVLHG